MNNFSVFEEKNELDRLALQSKLLKSYEIPVYDFALKNKTGLTVLDIGSNNGLKTYDRFYCLSPKKVIGIDCVEDLVKYAIENYGDETFSFHCHSVQDDDFESYLSDLMSKYGISGFDIINISFVLLHIKNPLRLLRILRRFLNDDGKLIILDADDSMCSVENDTDGLLEKFKEIVNDDPLSGNRYYSLQLPQHLSMSGFKISLSLPTVIAGESNDYTTKDSVFNTYFSYIPEDIDILIEQNPNEEKYKQYKKWLDINYPVLSSHILEKPNGVAISYGAFVAEKIPNEPLKQPFNTSSEFYVELLNETTVDIAKELCDKCVGSDLYSRQYFIDVLNNPAAYFYFLVNEDGRQIGYSYFYLTDLEDMSRFTKTDVEVLAKMSSKKYPVICDMRSLGISEEYRHRHLAIDFMRFSIDKLTSFGADVAFGAFWKIGDTLPMAKSIEKFGFVHLCDAKKIWYDEENLYCPVCKGRCSCDSALYYINLEGKSK